MELGESVEARRQIMSNREGNGDVVWSGGKRTKRPQQMEVPAHQACCPGKATSQGETRSPQGPGGGGIIRPYLLTVLDGL